MFNVEREWRLMEQHKHFLVQEACSQRLQREAVRDRIPFITRVILATSALLIASGKRLKARCCSSPEKPHEYIASPQDRIYT